MSGWILARELPEGALYFILRGSLWNAERLIVVAKLDGHRDYLAITGRLKGFQSDNFATSAFLFIMQILLTIFALSLRPCLTSAFSATSQSLLRRASPREAQDWDSLVDAVLTSDAKRREAETRLQSLQAERNRLSRQVGAKRSQGLDTASIEAQVSAQAAEMQALSQQATLLEEEQRELLLSLPNLPQENVPIGANSSHNPVVRTWGERPRLARTEDHRTIGSRLGLFDFDRAARMSGGGFVSYKGKGARLERALINFLLDLHTREHGYEEISPPFLIRAEALVGTSQLPKFEEQLYRIDRDALYLTPDRGSSSDQSSSRRSASALEIAGQIRRLYSLFSARSRLRRCRHARTHSHASIRQGRIGRHLRAGKLGDRNWIGSRIMRNELCKSWAFIIA